MKDLFAELQEKNKRVALLSISYSAGYIYPYAAHFDVWPMIQAKTWAELEDKFSKMDIDAMIKSQLLAAENRANELRAKLGGDK